MAYEDYLNDGEPIEATKGCAFILFGIFLPIALAVWYYVFHQESVNEFITQLCKNLFQP